jgi:8-oxo-dGTP pyrophosphatase MutT (NUDIX family)
MRFPAVAHVFLLRSTSLLLLRRCNTGFEDGNYGLPGGHLEEGESVRQAAVRECHEEIGIQIDEADLSVIGVSHFTSDSGEGIDIFLSTDRWIGEPRIVSECDELRWCPLGELPDRTIPFIRRATDRHLKNGEWFDEIGWDE